ncbi:MAG: tyrosine-type recombinase/integrase [Candidatus Korarchaeota archaeon]|nr:tyrosine-type recombinase/integrase [Candidatus Korarchaeota archaeon]
MGRVTPHMLRHSLLTHLAEAGLRAHEIKELAGHERLDTTGRYIHLRPEHLREAYKRCWERRGRKR